MSAAALAWIAIAGFVASSFTAMAARSLRLFSRHELEELCQARESPERFTDIVRHHESIGLGVELIVMLLIAIAVGASSLWIGRTFDWALERPWLLFVASVVGLGILAGVAAVWIPWSVARIGAARFLFVTWPLWRIIGRSAGPLVWGAKLSDSVLRRVFGGKEPQPDEESIEEEIRTIVNEGHREGLLEEEAREMIEGVIELGDVAVSHIMTPRTEIHMLPLNMRWGEVVENVVESGHTRIPVYDKTRDDIAGILYSKDLLPVLAKSGGEPDRPWPQLLRKPLFIPETKPVDDLLKVFQKSRTHIAVVLDEFGGVSGLVTIEDVLEEIVGEIDDEYDQQAEEAIHKINKDVCEAIGRAHIEEINEAMSFDLPEDADFDTIGGFVFAEFGRVPVAGESITWHDALRVTVLEASRRRVNRVRIERIPQESFEAV